MPAPTASVCTVSGKGLISGLSVEATVTQAPPGHGIVFYSGSGLPISARLGAVVQTERGVTLADASGNTLSIVEHFLAATAMAGLSDLNVTLCGAPELPILDGSAQPWLEALTQAFGQQAIPSDISLTRPVFYRHDDFTCLYAWPADCFQITYALDYPHPELKNQWARWNLQQDGVEQLAPARTFGFVRELPLLLEKGLAKGVDAENTVGIEDDGAYTDALRLPEEPIRHKMLDLIGDLALMGINPLRLKAHITALNAGHSSHTAFAKQLRAAIKMPEDALQRLP